MKYIFIVLLVLPALSYGQIIRVDCREIKLRGIDASKQNNSFLIKKDSIVHVGQSAYPISKHSYNSTWNEDIYDSGGNIQFILDEYYGFIMKTTGTGENTKIISYRRCLIAR